MNVLISGGSKNGKSYYAQKKAYNMAKAQGARLYYIATMIPCDEEDEARIKRHVEERRGWGFTTLEQGKQLAHILHDDKIDKNGVFLLDSVTALMSNEMFDSAGNMDCKAGERVRADLADFAENTGNTIFVSDNIYADAECYGEMTELYRRELAAADRVLAACCDEVIEISCGIGEKWK